ncbi:gluconokinase [Pontibacter sp. SGAir0037]|uniref:gluconokinase n=1 Tax=Pontibacter sp. SGAir0037 TaxID=2571030 RepID=UPI0010CD3FBA|nr:gluconokinase [Pontibacter sp. SGAir0037]QCR23180.1 gluconate kinase [Pontibacter sp. SGAir0037]
MKHEAIVGMDIGTTSTKAVAFDAAGAFLYQYTIEYPLLDTEPGYAEQDPDVVLQAVLDALKIVAAELAVKGYVLEGVSFSSAMHSFMALDAQGNLLTKCIIWADTRSKEYVRSLKNTALGHQIYLETGTPLHPMSPLLKLCWFKDHEPDIFCKAHKFIGIKEYVFFRLFGEFIIDYSIASATGLFNIFKLQWQASALDVAGITPDKLSQPVTPAYTLRNLQAGYAAYLGINPATPFIVGASDGCLANLGSNAVRPGQAAVTIGTSGAIRVMASRPATDIQERIFSYILTPRHFVLGGAVNNGGIVLRWFRNNFGEQEIAEALAMHADPYVLLCDKASTVPAGAEGLIFLPYLLGERAPIWDADARGCFFGIHFNHTRLHFLRALLEGVIFSVYDVCQALEQTTEPVTAIFASGGFARSAMWVQMLADICNIKVHLTETPEGSAFGAAIMGMYALGKVESLEVTEKMVQVIRTFDPDPQAHETYMKTYALYKALYPKLKDCFTEVVSLEK